MTEKTFKSNKLKHKLIKACVSDLDEIKFFEKQVLNDSSEYTSARNLKRIIKSADSEVLLVKDGKNKICAYAIVTLRHYKNVPSGHVYKIAVTQEYRRRGLATELIKKLEEFVINNSIFKIYAEARESNKASLGLFKKQGYKEVKQLFAHYSCLNNSYELENAVQLCKLLL